MPDSLPLPHPCYSGLRISPQGTLVVAHGQGLSFWRLETRQMLSFVPSTHFPVFVGRGLVCFQDGAAVLLDPETGAPRARCPLPQEPFTYDYGDPDAAVLLISSRSGIVVGFSLLEGRELYRVGTQRSKALGPDLFLTREPDATCIRSLDSGEVLWRAPVTKAYDFLLSPDRRWLAAFTGEDGDAVRVFELATTARVHTLRPAYDNPTVTFGRGVVRVYSSAPTPQSGNSDPDDETLEQALEDGPCHLPSPPAPKPPLDTTAASYRTANGRTIVARNVRGGVELSDMDR